MNVREWIDRQRRERRMRREIRDGRTIWVTHCTEKHRWHAQESHEHMHLEDGVVKSDVSICETNGIARALAALVPSDGSTSRKF